MIETKDLRMLQNVETRWVSLIDPMHQLLAKYQTMLGKVHGDKANAKIRFPSLTCRFSDVSPLYFLFLFKILSLLTMYVS
jgi:hypothetical protein